MQLADKKIVVTGAAGFIGSHLCDRLAEHSELVLIDDFSIGSIDNLALVEGKSNVRIETADITNLEQMMDLCAGSQVIFHLAISCLRTSLQHPFLSHDINAGGTLNLCLAARQHAVERLLYVSSSEIYGTAISVPMSEEHPCKPMTVYGASKLAGELYALAHFRTYGTPVSVVRPFNTYGPREPHSGARAEVIPRFIQQLERGRAPVIYGDGSQTRDFTYVEDTVTGLVAAAECDELVGDVVNVAYGREASILRIARLLAELMGEGLPEPVCSDPRPGDVDRHFADVDKASRLLGFEAQTDLEAGLAKTVEWFRSTGIAAHGEQDAADSPNW